MNRDEHLRWAKDRALEYAGQGKTAEAMSSLTSDLNKHPDTQGHSGIGLMMLLAMSGDFEKPGHLAEYIRGFQ